jgi:hypothetical protein
MLTIQNIDKIINITSHLPYKWYISAVDELPDDLYGFSVYINDLIVITFYLNRESRYMSGRNEPVYRLYKNFDQSSVNRWLSLHQISPYFIKKLIEDMLNE